MMGTQPGAAAGREQLEALVPAGHLLRRVDRALDLAGVRAALAPSYSRTGRPSVDPEVLLRLRLVGYQRTRVRHHRGAPPRRRGARQRRVPMVRGAAVRARVPQVASRHHSTFSRNRRGRFGAAVFRAVFEAVVPAAACRRCIAAGLVGGDACSVDGSMVDADASPQRHREPAAGEDFSAGPYPPANAPAKVSPTDPQAAWASKGGIARFAYYANYLVDNRRGVIVDVEASPARYARCTAPRRRPRA
jgi:transposase